MNKSDSESGDGPKKPKIVSAVAGLLMILIASQVGAVPALLFSTLFLCLILPDILEFWSSSLARFSVGAGCLSAILTGGLIANDIVASHNVTEREIIVLAALVILLGLTGYNRFCEKLPKKTM